MDYLGTIKAAIDPPGIDLERWRGLIVSHQSLAASPPIEGTNPFTKGPIMFRPKPGTARVVVDGKNVGMMHCALDGSRQIEVWGEAASVDSVARDVAARLGGVYQCWRR
jgi:hypothetical protein